MNGEKLHLVGPKTDNGFYTGTEQSTGEVGTSGISRRILHGLTVISVLIACGCTAYGSIQNKSAVFLLPLIVVLIWLFVHFLLLYFIQNDKHDFHPPAWFIFVSSGHIFIQSLIVIILTL
ncbi:unnamed protein product [Rotaria magnacalcarata]|uniref:Uncharacterized protein n=1 Tax=Rotaria magnacalcarata TaxID=392030 RepID=A0A816U034_9BILA|nr:unnamed protein product [Rotaria magnacalcarata]CAF1674690.1 unnamed protein product [Rotaria magnacalcarata]CAF2072680.1 unnamed protein product [Rotaria magnacalcarata]CAF2107714.1 unnamed protein product [Rotaria magnacalcarata]CAF2246256.1 unnamed protein product [Rotaria magnacalcarata]